MEIHHIGRRLCLLVTALFSLDLCSKLPQICVTFNSGKPCSSLFKVLCRRPEVGFGYFDQFVAGIALLFAFSVGFKILNLSFRPWSNSKVGFFMISDVCDLMERPCSVIGTGDSEPVNDSELSESEGSCGEERVFDEMSLGDFLVNANGCDPMELSRRSISLAGTLNGDRTRSIASSEDSGPEETFPEDRLTDEVLLRELVKSERRRAEAALMELEKERSAATTATEEAMLMILRLQRQKSSTEIDANQFRRLAEEKQRHDQEVIDHLRNIKLELEINLDALEGELSHCKSKLSSRNRCSCSCSNGIVGLAGFETDHEEVDGGDNENGDFVMRERFNEESEGEPISSLEFDSL